MLVRVRASECLQDGSKGDRYIARGKRGLWHFTSAWSDHVLSHGVCLS